MRTILLIVGVFIFIVIFLAFFHTRTQKKKRTFVTEGFVNNKCYDCERYGDIGYKSKCFDCTVHPHTQSIRHLEATPPTQPKLGRM